MVWVLLQSAVLEVIKFSNYSYNCVLPSRNINPASKRVVKSMFSPLSYAGDGLSKKGRVPMLEHFLKGRHPCQKAPTFQLLMSTNTYFNAFPAADPPVTVTLIFIISTDF